MQSYTDFEAKTDFKTDCRNKITVYFISVFCLETELECILSLLVS